MKKRYQNEEKVDGKPKDEHEPEDVVKDTNQKKEKRNKKESILSYLINQFYQLSKIL